MAPNMSSISSSPRARSPKSDVRAGGGAALGKPGQAMVLARMQMPVGHGRQPERPEFAVCKAGNVAFDVDATGWAWADAQREGEALKHAMARVWREGRDFYSAMRNPAREGPWATRSPARKSLGWRRPGLRI